MKLWWHKFTHWEYWSVNVVYLPAFFLWIWYAIRFRTKRFYAYANPSIKNGGLYGDSKMEIYQLLPDGSYPKTILVEHTRKAYAIDQLKKNGLKFPLIVKPDIGCRGVGVQKIHDEREFDTYAQNTPTNFLIQEMVEWQHEIGLFYYRLPNEKRGKISGITQKEFLTIEGNGQDTIEELLNRKPRFAMQVKKLRTLYNLQEILPLGEKRCLVPFGNHNRGTKFLDGSAMITQQLEQTFDALLSKIDGFYYGRLDIRYNQFEELEEGKNFSIIELNGTKSEPTHIYDPKHSFWFGQREIIRHMRILGKVVASAK